jgi:hypothetical protein
MGLILLPVFLAMLLGFFYQGIKLGIPAVMRARGRSTAALLLAVASAGLGLVGVIVPFALVASSRVSAWGFVFMAAACVAGVAAFAGAYLKRRFRATGKPIDGLFGAAVFLAAAAFPVSWFWLAQRLEAWFQVDWSY